MFNYRYLTKPANLCVEKVTAELLALVGQLGTAPSRLSKFDPKLRVRVTDDTRRKRGWVYDERKDNDPTETGLDGYNFDYTFDNDGDGPRALKQWANQALLPRMAQLLS